MPCLDCRRHTGKEGEKVTELLPKFKYGTMLLVALQPCRVGRLQVVLLSLLVMLNGARIFSPLGKMSGSNVCKI
jgi:hypothetical protein